MKGDELPASGHIVRYVKPSMVQEDGTPDGSEFRLRTGRPDEVGLSVNWLEAFRGTSACQLDSVRRVIRLTVRRTGRFAEMNVGNVKRSVAEESETLRIVHDPLQAEGKFESDPSHAAILGLPPGGSDHAILIGDLIAKCVIAMHPASALRDG